MPWLSGVILDVLIVSSSGSMLLVSGEIRCPELCRLDGVRACGVWC